MTKFRIILPTRIILRHELEETMPEFSVPKLTTLSSISKSIGRRRVLFVTMPNGDPFDLIGPIMLIPPTT